MGFNYFHQFWLLVQILTPLGVTCKVYSSGTKARRCKRRFGFWNFLLLDGVNEIMTFCWFSSTKATSLDARKPSLRQIFLRKEGAANAGLDTYVGYFVWGKLKNCLNKSRWIHPTILFVKKCWIALASVSQSQELPFLGLDIQMGIQLYVGLGKNKCLPKMPKEPAQNATAFLACSAE